MSTGRPQAAAGIRTYNNLSNARMANTTVVGIDISKDWLDVCKQAAEGQRHRKRFTNSVKAHQSLCRWLLSTPGACVRVVLEATGQYGLDLTLTLHETPRIEVMVVNPRATRKFSEAQMQRSKTDAIDAEMLCDFAQRMSFQPWEPPKEEVLELRAIARRIQALTLQRTQEMGRLHATTISTTAPAVVANDIKVNLRHLDRRIQEMTRQAMKVVRQHVHLKQSLDHLLSIGGVAEKSAVLLLPELMMLPSDLNVRQWVAHAGLDPRKHASGSSLQRPVRISKVGNVRIRRALYMPALVAVRCEPNIKAFYEHLLERGKKPIVAIVAVMRKLLHAIYGMLKHNQDFEGEKFYRMVPKLA